MYFRIDEIVRRCRQEEDEDDVSCDDPVKRRWVNDLTVNLPVDDEMDWIGAMLTKIDDDVSFVEGVEYSGVSEMRAVDDTWRRQGRLRTLTLCRTK